MAIGHEPTMSSLVAQLADDDSDAGSVAQARIGLPTGGMGVLCVLGLVAGDELVSLHMLVKICAVDGDRVEEPGHVTVGSGPGRYCMRCASRCALTPGGGMFQGMVWGVFGSRVREMWDVKGMRQGRGGMRTVACASSAVGSL